MRSEPIPLDLFGDFDSNSSTKANGIAAGRGQDWLAQSETTGTLSKAASSNAMSYRRGDTVWYRQRDGKFVPAKVVSVDVTVEPPSYAVDLGLSVRETEGHRLQQRDPADTTPPAAHNPGTVLPLPAKPTAASSNSMGVSIHASSGTAPLVSANLSNGSAASTAEGSCLVGNSWPAAAAQDGVEDDFGDFCDADANAAAQQPMAASSTADASGTAIALPAFTYMSAFAALPSPQAVASSPSPIPPMSFVQLSGFYAPGSLLEGVQPGAPVSAGAGAQMSVGHAPSMSVESAFAHSWPAASPATAVSASSQQPVTGGDGFGDFGDFEAAEWHAAALPDAAQAPGPAAGCGHASAKLPGSFTGSFGENPGEAGGRGVTPASTIDIAREELDFSGSSDEEDDFGDFTDACATLPAAEPLPAASQLPDRSAPLPMVLFGVEEDPKEPPLPSLDLAAPWGGFSFSQLPPPSTPAPLPQPATPAPTPALPATDATPASLDCVLTWPQLTDADQAALTPLASSAAPQLGAEDATAPAPATPPAAEGALVAADATPMPAAELPSAPALLLDGRPAAQSGSPVSFDMAEPAEQTQQPAPLVLGDVAVERTCSEAAEAGASVQEAASGSESEEGRSAAPAGPSDSQQGINWDALDFSFAEDAPAPAAAEEPTREEDSASAVSSAESIAGDEHAALAELSPAVSGALVETEIAGSAALPEQLSLETAPSGEQEDQDDEWGDFEAMECDDQRLEIVDASPWDEDWSTEAAAQPLQPVNGWCVAEASQQQVSCSGTAEPLPAANAHQKAAGLDFGFLGSASAVERAAEPSAGKAERPSLGLSEEPNTGGDWSWGVEDSWAVGEQAAPAAASLQAEADLWGTLASLDSVHLAPSALPEPAHAASPDLLLDAAWDSAGGELVGVPAAQPQSFAGHDRAAALLLLAQAAEVELAQGQRIWSEACASGRQNSFCAGSHTCQYSAALAAVYFVSRVLRSALRTGSDSAAGDKAPALAEVLARCEECWHGASGAPALKEAAAAAEAATEQAQLCAAVLDALGQLEGKLRGQQDWERSQLPDGPCCAITGLPLRLCPAVPAVEFECGSSWAPVANLWANRVAVEI